MRTLLLAAAFAVSPACVFVIAGKGSGSDEGQSSTSNASSTIASGDRKLTLDHVFGPKDKLDFSGRPTTNFVWVDAQNWLAATTENGRTRHETVEADTGVRAAFGDAEKMESAIAAIPGVTKEKARELARIDLDAANPARTAMVATIARDLWIVPFDGGAAVQVTKTPDADEELAHFSPDGSRIAFVRAHDLYVARSDGSGETRLTQDGGDLVLNGILDWIYQEEIYGRGNFRAHWWSPDSSSLAYLRLDEAGVPMYTLVDDVVEPHRVETSPYPRPGEPNPKVKLGLVAASGGATRWLDLRVPETDEPLVVDVAWSSKGDLYYQVQDRAQTRLELVRLANGASEPQVLFTETTKAWVERMESPRFLADGSYLWFSERTGFKHLYHYKDGELVRAVTSGEWEARDLYGVDEAAGYVYFGGTKDQAIGSDVYRVKLDGSGLERLSKTRGTHRATFNPTCTRYVDAWSDASTPTQVRLHRSDGSEVRTLDANRVEALERFDLSRPQFLQVPTRDGFPMEAMMIKPTNFDPSRRYPVMMFLYAGPHAQTVRDAWGGTGGMFQQLLAQRGVIVWACDNRSASGKGAVSAWHAYGRLGESECPDIQDGIAWLKRQSYVDGERIGVTGWSYGGFMTSYLLTHTQDFALGLAGGSVTSWRDYDSIYTERYMKLPKDNAEGYDRTSVVKAAKNLSGRLVLVHGSMDDNVHPSNTLRLADALQRADKQFGLYLYGRQRHGIVQPNLSRHWRSTMLAEIEEHLLDARP